MFMWKTRHVPIYIKEKSIIKIKEADAETTV